jgi:hypothetical protein
MRYPMLLIVTLSQSPALAMAAQDPGGLGSTITPATPSDPVVHHHKAYAKTTYGISCPGDRVVWVNTNSGVYHLEGERWFGRTATGEYECERAAKAEGDRETRNGQ